MALLWPPVIEINSQYEVAIPLNMFEVWLLLFYLVL